MDFKRRLLKKPIQKNKSKKNKYVEIINLIFIILAGHKYLYLP